MMSAVPVGYKQTELGVIPEDWEVMSFGEISKVSQGLQIAISSRLKNPTPTSKPYITIQYLNGGKEIEYIDNYPSTSYCNKDDVLMTRTGNTGIVVSGVEGIFHNNFFKIEFNKKILQRDFLIGFLNLNSTKKIILAKAGISTIPDLNHGDFYSILISIAPTIEEQTAIANALNDADGLIHSLQKLIAKKRQIKQGAMQTLLNPYENWVLKAGWVVKKLGEVADIRSGGTPSTRIDEYWNGNVLWCTPTDITALKGSKYIEDTARKISAKGLNDSSAEIIPANSIVMTSRATIGECAINLLPISTNQGFKNFVPFESTNVDFLYYLLQTKKQIFIGLCSGSTFLEISKNQISNIEIYIPENKENQTSIANILSDMDAEITTLETKLAKYQQVKQGMMQNLLTGRIRLV